MNSSGENMKPKIFIGSSKEKIKIAMAIETNLGHNSEITIWSTVVVPSVYALDELIVTLKSVDFAIFVFSPDDIAQIRDRSVNVVRDNVVFECGLAMGHLGRKRVFMVHPENIDFHVPTDLLGISPVKYDPSPDLKKALSRACSDIQIHMDTLGTKQNEQEVIGKEVIKIHMSTRDDSIFDKLNEACSIDIMSNTAHGFIKKYSKKMVQAVAENKCNVRILLSNSENVIWKDEAIFNGLCPGTTVRTEISDVLKILKIKTDALKERKKTIQWGYLEVKEYSNVPTCSIINIDNQIVRFTPYLPFAHSTEVPAYDVINQEKSELFHQLQKTFENVWEPKNSKTIFSFPD